MAVYHDDIVDIDLNTGTLHRSFQNKSIGEGDGAGNRYGIRLLRNGEPVDLTGAACTGWFTRPDGVTLVLDGQKENGVLMVTLPIAAYAVEGNFTLAIKASGTGFASTMRIVDGTVVDTTTGTVSDPAGAIPDLDALTAIINRAEAAAEYIDGLTLSAEQIEGTRWMISVEKEE